MGACTSRNRRCWASRTRLVCPCPPPVPGRPAGASVFIPKLRLYTTPWMPQLLSHKLHAAWEAGRGLSPSLSPQFSVEAPAGPPLLVIPNDSGLGRAGAAGMCIIHFSCGDCSGATTATDEPLSVH
jgi:hypothetical protein